MNTIKSFQVSLESGEVQQLNLSGAPKLTLICNEGSAWITSSGNREDFVVTAGHSIEIDRCKLLLLQSLKGHLELEIHECA